MPAQQKNHKVRGINVRMLTGGSGPTLLFLHGANGLPQWLPFFEQLSAKCHVMIPEHPGFGASDNPDSIRNIADLAIYYLDLLDGLKDERVHLVGQSLGGWIAAEVAARNCTSLASLTLLAPAGLRVKGVPSGDNFIWDPEESVRNLYHDQSIADRLLATSLSPEDADLALNNRYATAKFGWEPRWYNPGLHGWLHRVSVPSLVVWGENDKLFPVRYAARWGELLPKATVEILPACGHVPAVEKPDVTAQKILSLVERS